MLDSNRKISDDIIGYSALRIYDECYEYNENACYIADTDESLEVFLVGAMLSVEDYKIKPVKTPDMLIDFGCSSGEFALEPKALQKFEEIVRISTLSYWSSLKSIPNFKCYR